MRLDTKFRISFLYPLVFSVIISFIIVVLLIISFSRNYNNEDLKNDLQFIDSQKALPVFLAVNNILFQKFQKSIYSLILIKKHYDLYRHIVEKNNFNLTSSDPKRITYNPEYTINALKLADYKNKMNELFESPNNKEKILDYSFWFVDKKLIEHEAILGTSKTNTDSNNNNYNYTHFENLRNELTALQYTFPMINSIYKAFKTDGDTINSYDSIYFASSETSLFYSYPIDITASEKNKNYFNDTSFFFKNFKKYTYSAECIDEDGNEPDYFYFQCRDWWIQLDTEFKNQKQKTKEQIVITNPYKFAGETKYGITTCLSFVNEYVVGKKDKISAFCLDMDISDLQSKFDELNRQISGYFYVLKVNTHYTIYYPYMNTDVYFSNLERLEFDMINQYYVSELSEFSTNVLKKLQKKIEYPKWEEWIKDSVNIRVDGGQTGERNSTSYKEIVELINGYYFKNQKNFTYLISPVYFYENFQQEENKSHMLSIIYVFENEIISQNLNSFVTTLFPRLVFQVILYLLLAVILIEISWHLITTIGFNIVRPIKNLKFQIRGMNAENTDFDKKLQSRSDTKQKSSQFANGQFQNQNEEENFLQTQQQNNKSQNSSFIRKKQNSTEHSTKLQLIKTFNKRLTARRSTRKKSEYQAFSQYTANSDDSFSEELDEDDLGIISSEMSGLFNTVIELKNIITFTLDKNAKYDSHALIKYLGSVHMFAKVQNYSAERISESNIGAMLLNFKKFNYAVFHLKKCLINSENASIAKLAQQLACIKKMKELDEGYDNVSAKNNQINNNNFNNNYNYVENKNINNYNKNEIVKLVNAADDTKSVCGLKAVCFEEIESKDETRIAKNNAGLNDLNFKEFDKQSKAGNNLNSNYNNHNDNNNAEENEIPIVTIKSNFTEKLGKSIKKLKTMKFANLFGGKKEIQEIKNGQKNKMLWDINVINVKDLIEIFENNLIILENEAKIRQTLQKINLKKMSALFYAKNKKSTFSHRSNDHNEIFDSPNQILNRKSPILLAGKGDYKIFNKNNIGNNNRNEISANESTIVFENTKNFIKSGANNSRSLNVFGNIGFMQNNSKDGIKDDELNKIMQENVIIDKDKVEINMKASSDNLLRNNNFNSNNINQQKKVFINQGNILAHANANFTTGNFNNIKNQKEKALQNSNSMIHDYHNNFNIKETNYANITIKNSSSEINKLLNSVGEAKNENLDNYEFSEFPILNIKSRYPKLIYSFNTYFKTIRSLFKKKSFDKAKFFEDILVFTEQINLDLYEKVILLYIQESMMQKNLLREMEGVLKYIDFLIVYKLKIFLDSEKTDSKENEYLFNYFRNSNNRHNSNYDNYADNSNNNYFGNLNSQGDFKNNFNKNRNSKIDAAKNIMQRINFFFSYFELLKKKFIFETSPDYFKSLLEIITEKRIDDLDLTEIPYSVLIMQCNYLKGKLAKICGHYNKALEYFYKSREYLTVCDAWIIKKSNKNIKKIYEVIYQKVESDIYRIENASSEADMDYIEKNYFSNFASGSYNDSKKSSPEISSRNNNNKLNNININLNQNNNNNRNNKNLENAKLLNLSPNGNHNDDLNSKSIKKHFSKNQSSGNNRNNNNNDYNSNQINNNNNLNNMDEANNRESHHHSNNPNLKQLTVQQKIEKKKQILQKYKSDIIDKIVLLDKEINSFLDCNKDLVIIIDISGINETDIKKFENLLKLSCGFYENYVCLGDRFGVFLGFEAITPLIPFEIKHINNYQFTKSNLNSAAKNLSNYGFVNSINPFGKGSEKMKICKSILLVFEYLNKKWNCKNEKWVILFLSNFDLDYENKRKIENESLIRKYLNLIIIGIDFDQESINRVKEFLKLFGDKSHFFCDDNVGGLKSIFRKKVFDENKTFYPFEVYKTGKINNFDNFK